MKEDKKILFSAGRTGSTFIYQIMKEIFPNVEKLHKIEMKNYLDKDYDCVVTTRNVVDAYLSRLRTVYCGGDADLFLERIKDPSFVISDIFSYREELVLVKKVIDEYKGRVLVISYKSFNKNPDFVFNCFEKFFGIKIKKSKKLYISKKYCLEENLKIQNKLKDFKDEDKDSKIHGNHIWSEKEDYSKGLIDENQYNYLKNFFLS